MRDQFGVSSLVVIRPHLKGKLLMTTTPIENQAPRDSYS